MAEKEYKNIRIISNFQNNNIKIDKTLLEDELRCPICKIYYDSNIHIPFVISCGHTFCKQCIFNNSNNKCPLDSNINTFKLYIRNIQLEEIVNKILINNKDFQNQQKMIYIKPDMKNKKKSLNDIGEEKIKTDIREKTNRTRGKSINQRVKKNNYYEINSPESGNKNYNKKFINKHFKSPNVNKIKNGNKFDNIIDDGLIVYNKKDNLISYKLNEENENKLNFIEDNFKFEDEKEDDILINETIGTIPIYEEKSSINSIREDFNDLLTKNEIYKKRIINNNININSNERNYIKYNFVSPIKQRIKKDKEAKDINENFFNEKNQKIILFEETDFPTQKPLRLSNYNISNHPCNEENRQLTEANIINNVKKIDNTKTEKKTKDKNYHNFFTSSINQPFNPNIRNSNKVNNDTNNKNIKTIFDYIKSINKLSSNNNTNTLHKNLSKNKDDFFEDYSNNMINKRLLRVNSNDINDKENGSNIININNYNNNLRKSLQETNLLNEDFNLVDNRLPNSPGHWQKYIKVKASSRIPKKNENINNNENIDNDTYIKNISPKTNKKLKQIKVKKDSINNINIYSDKNNNNSNNSNNSSSLYNKKKIFNKNSENINNSELNLEIDIDKINDKEEKENNEYNIKQTIIKDNKIISNINNINITISPKKINRKLNEDKILKQKLDFTKTINNRSSSKMIDNINEKEINNIIRVGEFLSKNKIEQSRSLSSNKNRPSTYKNDTHKNNNLISKLKEQYNSLNFQNLSQSSKRKYDNFFQNSLNSKIILDLINSSKASESLISVRFLQNKNLFIGELEPNFQNPIKGIMISSSLDYYEGSFINGKKEGKGKLIYNNGTEYIGTFKNNKQDGYGQLTQENGEIYQGEWKEGRIHGNGTRFHKNGDKYIGNYIDNVRSGYGIYIFSNGNIYEGNWVKGKANGKGIFKYNNGNIYEGDFKDNLISGKGKLTLKNGDIYEGMFVNGTIHGEGSYTNNRGEKYTGYFKKGKKDGKGKLEDKNGNLIMEGTWNMNEFLYK